MYDREKDYQAEINKAVAAGDMTAAAEAEKLRNEKIDGEGLDVQKTFKYTQDPSTIQQTDFTSPQSMATDYMASAKNAENDGRYNDAGVLYDYHNQKSGEAGIGTPVVNPYKYSDPYDYARENMRGEIRDYSKKGFSYDPEGDASYNSIKKTYENQARSDYNNTITRLAEQYGGEIPAYLRQIALGNYQTQSSRANEAIPELQKMAYDMWAGERNDLYNRYGLLSDESRYDYGKYGDYRNLYFNNLDRQENKYRDRRDFLYSKAVNDRNYDRDVYESDRSFDRGVLESDRNFDEGVRQFDEGMNFSRDQFDWSKYMDMTNLSENQKNRIASIAASLIDPKMGIGVEQAYQMALRLYGGAAGGAYEAPASSAAVYTGSTKGGKSTGGKAAEEEADSTSDKYYDYYLDENGKGHLKAR